MSDSEDRDYFLVDELTPFWRRVHDFVPTAEHITYNVGPKLFRFNRVINWNKGSLMVYLLFLMFYFDNFSGRMWMYTAMHGSYGIFWITKDILFPDKGF